MPEQPQQLLYWQANPHAAQKDQWTSNEVIGAEVYRRISRGASSGHWLPWLFDHYFQRRRFASMLSPGCGVGDHELMAAELGLAQRISAFDFSQTSIDIAKQKALDKKMDIEFYVDDVNSFRTDRTYDIILCAGVLHHVKELEFFLSTLKNALAPGGYLIVNEYVGDCYNIYRDSQVHILRSILNCFDESAVFANPSIGEIIARDPSEGVRSKIVRPFLKFYFEPEYEQEFGGCLLHPLYPQLNQYLHNAPTRERDTIIKLLLRFEQLLMDAKTIDTDFYFGIFRAKNH